ncbi:MAG: L-threonylcarbamoyladenylate synthase [Planctomycetota bacterium]
MATPTVLDGRDPRSIERAVERLRQRQAVAMPTETVYGLAADGLDAQAVAGVFDLKRRPRFDPLILHVAEPAAWSAVATGMSEAGRRLAEAMWPGPITLVAPRRAGVVPDLVTAGLETVAVRCPSHPVASALLRVFGGPLAAPSANRFGAVSPTRADHVVAEFAGEDLAVLDGGPSDRGLESTVVRVVAGEPVEVLRLGAVTVEAIAGVIGEEPAVRASTSRPSGTATEGKSAEAPGMLDRHYAPRTPLRLMTAADAAAIGLSERRVTGLLACDEAAEAIGDGFAAKAGLGSRGDPAGMAARLFAAMRELDAAGVTQLVAVPVEPIGLGRAINDRLARASA